MEWPSLSVELTTCLVFGIVFLFLLVIMKRDKTDVPGPFAWPIIGNCPLLLRTPITKTNQLLDKLAEKYGPVFRIYIGNFLFVFVCGYDNIHGTFVKNSGIFSDRPSMLPNIRRSKGWLGVIWSSGDYWKKVRRFALHTMRDFGVGKKSLEEIVLEETRSLDAFLEENQGKSVTHIKQIMTTAVSNVIHSVVFGFRYQHDDEKFKEILESMDEIFKQNAFISTNVLLPMWVRMIFNPGETRHLFKSSKTILGYLEEQRLEHEKSYDENNIRDFVDLHIKNKREKLDDSYTDDTMKLIILNLFAAGTETTATTLDWALLYMIGYPEIQKKCHEQIQKVVGDSRMVRTTDRSELVFVDATLMEIQRIANIQTTLPHVASEDTTLDGYNIPKGAVIMGSLRSAHYDTKYWDKPEVFTPERFIDANGKIIKPEAFIPFSLGPRVCMGETLAKMEMFLIFSNLLQRFKFSKANESDKLEFEGVSGITTAAPLYELVATLR